MKINDKNASQQCGREKTLVFLLQRPLVARSGKLESVRLEALSGTIDVPAKMLVELANAGMIARDESRISLTPAGSELAERLRSRANIELVMVPEPGNEQSARAMAAINRDESPLSALHSRKMADGTRFLTCEEFNAGERLRLDFTKGMLMPRVSANWQASVSAGRRSGNTNGIADLTDTALAARLRVQSAMEAIGDQLGGVATDICCFLKGFEQVELERKWPKRSAKFMLKAALSVLALYYWPRSTRTQQTRHWGADGYRPNIGKAE